MYRLLVVEDSEDVAELLATALQKEGLYCVVVEDGGSCHEYLRGAEKSKLPDIIVLDLNLPDISGWDVCKKLKLDEATKHIPIIMITGEYRNSADVINGFQHGCDDYIAKPFNIEIFLARVMAILRRTAGNKGAPPDLLWSAKKKILVNRDRRSVSIKNGASTYRHIDLTRKEYEILCLFLRKPSQTLSKEMLYENIWGKEYDIDNRTVDKHIETLRKKLGGLSEKILTVSGAGYVFVDE